MATPPRRQRWDSADLAAAFSKPEEVGPDDDAQRQRDWKRGQDTYDRSAFGGNTRQRRAAAANPAAGFLKPEETRRAEAALSAGEARREDPWELSARDTHALEKAMTRATAAVWLAVVSWLTVLAGLITSPLAIFFAIKARMTYDKYPLLAYRYGKGRSTAALWLACIHLAPGVILFFVLLNLIA